MAAASALLPSTNSNTQRSCNFTDFRTYSIYYYVSSSNFASFSTTHRFHPSGRRTRRSFYVNNVASDLHQLLNDSAASYPAQGTSLDTLEPDSASVMASIKYHAEFTPSFSPELFELPKAFVATAQSVRYMLFINWNATYDYYEKLNVKQAYYLSMEFLQGRALLNAIGNLGLTGPYAEALGKLGHSLEDIIRQVFASSISGSY